MNLGWFTKILLGRYPAPISKKEVERALTSKGFQETSGDHHFFVYYTIDGRRTRARTKTSRGGKRDIGDAVLNQMAKQCKINNSQFQDLMNRPLSREQYEEILRTKNEIE